MCASVIQTDRLMNREIVAECQHHTAHIETLCEICTESSALKLAVHRATTRLQKVKQR
jgi:hypothetical protein